MKSKAFTLAETLVTIGIIGIVAAMTIPPLINNYKAQVTATKLKKTYSILSQAMNAAVAKYGDSKYWPEWETSAEEVLRIYLAPEIINAKVYPTASSQDKTMCYERKPQFHYNDSYQYGWMNKIYMSSPFFADLTASMKLLDGTCIGLNGVYPRIPAYGKLLFIDINSPEQGPNMAGYDLFFFQVEGNNIIPRGHDWPRKELSLSSRTNSCHVKAYLGGLVCAAKIMEDNWEIKYW
ncbi:type II secretion system protein [bacterium]|nr:type II secretion system protein [bacterium]